MRIPEQWFNELEDLTEVDSMRLVAYAKTSSFGDFGGKTVEIYLTPEGYYQEGDSRGMTRWARRADHRTLEQCLAGRNLILEKKVDSVP